MEVKLDLSDYDMETVMLAKKQDTKIKKETLAVVGDIFLSNLKL